MPARKSKLLSTGLGSRGIRDTLRGFLALMSFLAGMASLHSEARPIIGHVLDFRGDWYLYGAEGGDAQSRKLSKWQELPAGGIVRVKSPAVDNYIVLVDQRLKIFVERSCRAESNCSQPIYLPKSSDEISGTDAYAVALRKIWKALLGDPYERSMHRVRGMTSLSEGIAPIRDGEIDLAEPMRGISKGKYALLACRQRKSCELERNRDSQETLTFDWDPALATTVTVGRRGHPGLYEVRASQEPGPSASGVEVSVRILVCGSQSYPPALASFRRLQAITDKWGEAATPETAHSFLRAYLSQVATAGACTK
jgi:hypothetical protein